MQIAHFAFLRRSAFLTCSASAYVCASPHYHARVPSPPVWLDQGCKSRSSESGTTAACATRRTAAMNHVRATRSLWSRRATPTRTRHVSRAYAAEAAAPHPPSSPPNPNSHSPPPPPKEPSRVVRHINNSARATFFPNKRRTRLIPPPTTAVTDNATRAHTMVHLAHLF